MAPKIYQVLEHRADLKIKVWGKNLKELFNNSLLAMCKSMKPKTISQTVKRKISIQAIDLEDLLVSFLSEALYLSQIFKESYQKIIFQKSSFEKKFFLEGFLLGKKIKNIQLDIKAVTYHDLEIKKEKTGWSAVILFDV